MPKKPVQTKPKPKTRKRPSRKADAASVAPKPKTGRPPLYSQELADEFCRRVAVGGEDGKGRAIHSVCRDPGMPSEVTVYKWRSDETLPFAKNLARARAVRFERAADSMMDLAESVQKNDGPDPARVRAAIDGYDKAARLLSEKTRRVEVSGPGGKPVEVIDFTGWTAEKIQAYRDSLANALAIAES